MNAPAAPQVPSSSCSCQALLLLLGRPVCTLCLRPCQESGACMTCGRHPYWNRRMAKELASLGGYTEHQEHFSTQAPLVGAVGQEYVHSVLTSMNPQNAVKEIQKHGAFRNKRCKPVLELLDQLGLKRYP